jgi:hypothetical protein
MSDNVPPAYPPQPGPPVPRRRGGNLLVGLVLGLVFGAAAMGVAWAITASSGSDDGTADPKADAEAVCGVVERSRVPKDAKDMKNLTLEDIRRWGVAEVGPSLAKQDPGLKPLADALEKVLPAIQRFDIEQAKDAIDQVKGHCADL